MAVITGPKHSSIWDRLGTGLGAGYQKGVSEQLKALAEQRIKGLQAEKFSQLFGGGPAAPTEAPDEGGPPGEAPPSQPPGEATMPSLSDVLSAPFLSTQEKMNLAGHIQRGDLAEKKMAQQERFHEQKLSAREQAQVDKETFKAYESYSTAAEDARNKIPLVKEFINISMQGDPGSPASNTMREVLGNFAFGKDVPKDWLYTDNATIQRKLSAQLVKLTLEKMEGRKSVEVLKAIRRTFPNIYQNRGAQTAIAKTLLYEYNMNDLKDRLQDRIIEENNGRRPRNLKSLVEKLARRLEPAIAKKYLPNIGARA